VTVPQSETLSERNLTIITKAVNDLQNCYRFFNRRVIP
jgi:hypothetical protein